MVNHPNRSKKSPLAALRKALAEHWQEVDWDNPPDGEVLLYWPGKKSGHHGQITHGPRIQAGWVGGTPHRPPTHWMPLPSPPALSLEKDSA